MAILDLKKQMADLSLINKKQENKLNQQTDQIERLEAQNRELKDQLEEYEKERTKANNKLMSSKFSKDELARRLADADERLARKDAELKELQERFDDHIKSNQATEASLYSRIKDLSEELTLQKSLKDEIKLSHDKLRGKNSDLLLSVESLSKTKAEQAVVIGCHETTISDLQSKVA